VAAVITPFYSPFFLAAAAAATLLSGTFHIPSLWHFPILATLLDCRLSLHHFPLVPAPSSLTPSAPPLTTTTTMFLR